MTDRVIPLEDLAQRISQQQAALEKLRKEYETRQGQLGKLMRRKAELQAQIKQVEAQIKGIGLGNQHVTAPAARATSAAKSIAPKSAMPKPVSPKTSPAKPTATKPTMKRGDRPSLPRLLVEIVAKAKAPMSNRELVAEVVRRKYPTTSSNLANMVDTRVHELVKKGVLRRAKDQPGVLLADAAETPSGSATKPKSAAPASASKPKGPVKAANIKPPAASSSEWSLPDVVTKVLASSSHPMSARQLAEKVLATGYKTKSKNFTNVIWAGVSKMSNIENVPGNGYRLKKTK